MDFKRFPTNLTNFLSSFGIVYVSILKAHLLEAHFKAL